jgi:hypothetical protein
MTDDRLRRCSIHGPELRAYVEALVKAEKGETLPLGCDITKAISIAQMVEEFPRLPWEGGGATIVTEEDGEYE